MAAPRDTPPSNALRVTLLKRFPIVEEDEHLPHEMQHQIGPPIVIDILKAERNRIHILTLPVEGWPYVDDGLAGVSAWQLDHVQVSMQIDGNEVTGMAGTIAVPHHGIGLIGARIAIVQIVLPALVGGWDGEQRGRTDHHHDPEEANAQ